MKKGYKNLFQITEAAQACGLSRSTLMRMEEKRSAHARLHFADERSAILRQFQCRTHSAGGKI